jgi:DNA polymerase III gamma/tau subunit
VGKQSKAFWLNATNLDENAAGSLYEVISNNTQENESAQSLFEQAIAREESELEKRKMQDICRVEPLLAECELLLTVLMSQRFQSNEEVYQRYLKLERNVSSIIQLARDLEVEVGIKEKFQVGVVKSRYEALIAFGKLDSTESLENMTALIEALLKYHRTIMNQRGQSPWVECDSQGVYRCHVKLRNLPTVEQRPYKTWFNGYYLDQFKNLIHGLEGKSND